MSGKIAGLAVAAAVAVALVLGFLAVVRDDGPTQARADASASPTASPVQPAPNGGDVSETEAPGTPGPTVKARITRAARFSDGVQVKVLSTRTAKVKARGPGEGSGPAVVARLEIQNTSREPVDVDGAMVTLLYGDDQVAEPSALAQTAPFVGRLGRGETGRGTYAFRVPPRTDPRFTVVVQYGAGSGVARFVP